jgi:pSer/pThr/pTyr-binding forkhead associated (FHA) protein
MKYRLRFILQEFDLPTGPTFLGRDDDCEVTLDDGLVSRRHARIDVDDSGASITDLGSRNGTHVNGVRTRGTTTLVHRDRIRLGRDEMVFIATVDSLVDSDPVRSERATRPIVICPECQTEFAVGNVCPQCSYVIP